MENVDGTAMSTCSNKKIDWYDYDTLICILEI